MDLSTGKTFTPRANGLFATRPCRSARSYLSSAREVGGRAEELTWEIYRDTLIEQASRGSITSPSTPDAFKIHPDDGAARHRHRLARRLDHGEMVSRAHQESFLYTVG